MGMKPIHGDGSDEIRSGPIAPTVVSAANAHPSGKWGAVSPLTVSQPKYEGNTPQVVDSNLVSHAKCYFEGDDKPDHSGGKK